MKKNIAVIAFLTILSFTTLTACGKSEEENVSQEIYNNHDAADEEQDVDNERQEIVDYKAEKQNENGETEGIDYMATLTEWELGKDIEYTCWDLSPTFDIGQSLFIYYPNPQYVTINESGTSYRIGDESNPFYNVACYPEDLAGFGLVNEEIYDTNEKIGNYKVLMYTDTKADNHSTTITVYHEITQSLIRVTFKGCDDNIEDLINKNWDYIIEQVKTFPVAEAVEIPYGVYISESGAQAKVDISGTTSSVKITLADGNAFYYVITHRSDGTLRLVNANGVAGTLSSDGSAITITGTEKADGTYFD